MQEVVLNFHPRNVQFILYDPYTVTGDEEDSLWERDDEQGPLSSRRTELAIGLFDDYQVEIKITTHDQTPDKPEALWDIEAAATLLIQSGTLGVRDVSSDIPEEVINLRKGWINVRVFGIWLGSREKDRAAQLFHLQLWPKI